MKYSSTNKPIVCMQTNSTCYKKTRIMTPVGVLWHSTGANNSTLKRYVQPFETDANYQEMLNLIGVNKYGNDWNHIDVEKGMNGWIGKLADGTVATIQSMPWDYRPWGCGSGSNGSCNNGWIQFEICEDGLTDPVYFNEVYTEACELTAYLLKMYNIDPHGKVSMSGKSVPTILCHYDSYQLGMGSNHGDVLTWFKKHGKTMDDVRNDVAKLLAEPVSIPKPPVVTVPVITVPIIEPSPVYSTGEAEIIIWDFLKQKGLTDAGAAGLMGNLYAESGFVSRNLQQTYEKKLGFTDDMYTEYVDNGIYNNFVHDSAGYGIAQWTYHSRKQNLLNYAKAKNKSVGDLQMQLDFLWEELSTSYKKVVGTLLITDSVLEASNSVLFNFEKPANQDASVQNKRASYGETYYAKYGQVKVVEPPKQEPIQTPTIEVSPSSSIVDYVKYSPNKSIRESEIDTVTIHCVVGQCTVESLGNWFSSPSCGGSSNYGVASDGKIGEYVPEDYRAWTTGGRDEYGNEIFVNGISGAMNDHRAITIEVASDTVEPYTVTDAAYEGLIRLLVDICKRHPKIGKLKWMNDKNLVGQVELQNMTAHRWFANKSCPGDYLYSRFGDIANKVNAQLNLPEEEEDLDVVRFKELFDEMRNEFRDNDASLWSQEARMWALSTGLVQGNGEYDKGQPNGMWEDLMTREQLVTVLYRFAQMMGKV